MLQMTNDSEIDEKVDKDYKFHMNKELDDKGCVPKCPAHQTFGLDFCQISTCTKCRLPDDVSNLKREYAHEVYMEEVFATMEGLEKEGISPEQITLTFILKTIIKKENDFNMQYQDIKICQ